MSLYQSENQKMVSYLGEKGLSLRYVSCDTSKPALASSLTPSGWGLFYS